MAQTYWPFDSGAGANVVESQWRQQFRQVVTTGVFRGVLNALAAYADSTGMQVKVPSGSAWILGHFFSSDAEVILAIAAADPVNPRIDRVIVRADFTGNTIALAVLTGIAAGVPAAPALTQTATTWEISLAQVAVAALAPNIAPGNVTDERVFAGYDALVGAGTVGAPSVARNNDIDTGMYFPALNQVALAVGGAQGFLLSATQAYFPADGAAATPGVAVGEATTGIYLPAAGRLGFASGGVARGEFDVNGHFVPGTNATYDLGLTGNRWRNLWVSTNITAGGAAAIAGAATVGTTLWVGTPTAADQAVVSAAADVKLALIDTDAGVNGVTNKVRLAFRAPWDSVNIYTKESAGIEAGITPVTGFAKQDAYLAFFTSDHTVNENIERVRITHLGQLLVGATANDAKMAGPGIVVNQGAADDSAFSLKSTDVAHGITDIAETDTAGFLRKAAGTIGGLGIVGLSEGDIGVDTYAYGTTEQNTRSTGGYGYHNFDTYKKSGTGGGALTAGMNLLSLRNNSLTDFIFAAGGDLYANASINADAYDDYDDVGLIRALEVARGGRGLIRSEFDAFLRHDRAAVERAGLATFNDGPGGDGSVFVNYTAGVRVLFGAAWQLERRKADRAELDDLRAEVAALRALVAAA